MTEPTTIAAAIDACLENLSRAPRTVDLYRTALGHFRAYLAGAGTDPAEPLAALTVEHFIGFAAWVGAQGFSRSTRICYLAGARVFLDALTVQGHLDPTYRDAVRLKLAVREETGRQRERHLPKLPAAGVVEAMVKAARALDTPSPGRERDIALVEFLRTSGCRIDEVRRLRVEDLDTGGRLVRVRGKGDKERVVPVGSAAIAALLAYWAARGFADPGDPAFARHDRGAGAGRKPMSGTGLREAVARVADAAGLWGGEITPHAFRHAFATKLYEATRDLPLVQETLGHADPKTTRVYAEVGAAHLRAGHRQAFGD